MRGVNVGIGVIMRQYCLIHRLTQSLFNFHQYLGRSEDHYSYSYFLDKILQIF